MFRFNLTAFSCVRASATSEISIGDDLCLGKFCSKTERNHTAASADIDNSRFSILDSRFNELHKLLRFWSGNHRAFIAKKNVIRKILRYLTSAGVAGLRCDASPNRAMDRVPLQSVAAGTPDKGRSASAPGHGPTTVPHSVAHSRHYGF